MRSRQPTDPTANFASNCEQSFHRICLIIGSGPKGGKGGANPRFPAANTWEPLVGYSRAGRWPHVHVAGTHPQMGPMAKLVARAMFYAQGVFSNAQEHERALDRAGASLQKDVVRNPHILTNICGHGKRWEKPHGKKFFRDIRPASSISAITALVSPEMLSKSESGSDRSRRKIAGNKKWRKPENRPPPITIFTTCD